MGAVLKGRDCDLGRDLAVKILLESHRDKPEMIRRFIEEAQIAGQLQHPGIVPIYELGAFGDRRPYFAMKLVKGHTLAEILAKRKSPSDGLPRLLAIFEIHLPDDGLRACPRRDPSRLETNQRDGGLIRRSAGDGLGPCQGPATRRCGRRRPRGSDAPERDRDRDGATASDSDHSRAGSVLGTPSYMAPEQARGEVDRLDERCDVFALGSILCELLTGRRRLPAGRGTRSSARPLAARSLAPLTGSIAAVPMPI